MQPAAMRAVPAGGSEAAVHGPWGRTVFVRATTMPGTDAVVRLVGGLRAGECIAFAIPLNGSAAQRLRALATYRLRTRRILRALHLAGVEQIRRFGVDPDLEMPSCIYELDTDAAEYAERCLRPRGRLHQLRLAVRLLAGCDPALGAIVIVARKRIR